MFKKFCNCLSPEKCRLLCLASIYGKHLVILLVAFVLLRPLAAVAESQAVAPPSSMGTSVAPAVLPLFDIAAENVENRFSPDFGSEGQVTAVRSKDPKAPGIAVTILPGRAGNPGIVLKPEGPDGAVWDLSKYGHIEARIFNTGAKPLSLSVRVDNPGDWKTGPWNCEPVNIPPGASSTATVIFGYSYNKRPGFKLNPATVSKVLLFTGKSNEDLTFRIESIQAGGPAGETPPLPPDLVRVKPKNNLIFGGDLDFDFSKQINAKQGKASMEGKAVRIEFGSGKGQMVSFKPAIGRWDLSEATEVIVRLKNLGLTPANPRIQLASNGGDTDEIQGASALAPGAAGEIVASFIPTAPRLWTDDSLKSTAISKLQATYTGFVGNAVGEVRIMPDSGDAQETLLVESIEAISSLRPVVLPNWVGSRPPVEGEWKKTFDEEFDGKVVNDKKWNVHGVNLWDKTSHFSRNNVITEDGVARLRYEKKTGTHCDDPSNKPTDYATGYLDTYDKWSQRYGYFEARLKLPKGAGMHSMFCLLPDHGINAGSFWRRIDTVNGGMEFDIMEYLGCWRGHLYNTAIQWDGYAKGHPQTIGGATYFAPDKHGFVTVGLLWLPGLAISYSNGREVMRLESSRVSNAQSAIVLANVTGGRNNDAVDDTKLPDDFVIDYVRAWQRKDLASGEDGPKSAVNVASNPAPTPVPAPETGAVNPVITCCKIDKPVVAITFDDGPTSALTPKLLDILKEHGAKATLFVIGQKAAEFPELLKRAVDEGHEIGNHSWSHPFLTRLGPRELRAEILGTTDAVFKTTGKKTVLMRPPYLAFDADVIQVVCNESGMKIISLNVDSLDWANHKADKAKDIVLRKTVPGSIILCHETEPSTIEALPDILEGLKAKGFQFVTVSELIGMESAK